MQDIMNEVISGLEFLINVEGLVITIPTDVLINIGIQNSKIKKMADYYFEHQVPAVLNCNKELFNTYILPYIAYDKIPDVKTTNTLGCTKQIIKIAEDLALQDFVQRFQRFNLKILKHSGNPIFLSLHSNRTIKEIKQQIEAIEGIPVDQLRLFYRSNIPSDDRTLDDMGVKSEDEMTLTLRLRGD